MINRVTRPRTVKINADADTTKAFIDLMQLQMIATALDGRNINIDVDVNSAPAIAGLAATRDAAESASGGMNHYQQRLLFL